MKNNILSFIVGSVCTLLAWFLMDHSAATPDSPVAESRLHTTSAGETRDAPSEDRLTTKSRVRPDAKKNQPEAPEKPDIWNSPREEIASLALENDSMETFLRENSGFKINYLIAQLALRLKLTPAQQQTYRELLLKSQQEANARILSAMNEGGKISSEQITGLGVDDEKSLLALLTSEQQTAYDKHLAEQREVHAQEFALSHMRKMSERLQLDERQKDEFYDAYLKQKMASNDSVPGSLFPSRHITGSTTEMTRAANGKPLDVVTNETPAFDSDGILRDRSITTRVLRPEQLEAYDAWVKSFGE